MHYGALPLFVGLFAFLGLALEGPAVAGIAGSPHDFSAQSWSGGQVCIVCHSPHVPVSPALRPLWNHALSNQVYTPYSSDTMSAIVGQPDGSSKLCLGCHDGTIATDAFSGRPGSQWSGGSLGTDLRDHHPISFVYDSSLAASDPRLRDPDTSLTELGGTVARDLLSAGKVQCSSCHEVHNRFGNSELFRIPDDNGRLCQSCHNL
ncbi:MAG: cytochrome C [Oligoflexia bacterium]|nr:cytochrome C [Oligoflexia bacterium]